VLQPVLVSIAGIVILAVALPAAQIRCLNKGATSPIGLIIDGHTWRLGRTASRELAPVEGEVHDKQGSECERNYADGSEAVAKMAPVAILLSPP
jgi:hypothetical protein